MPRIPVRLALCFALHLITCRRPTWFSRVKSKSTSRGFIPHLDVPCIIPGRYPGYPVGEEVEFKRGRDMPLPQGCGASMTARPSHPLRLFSSSHLPCVLAFPRVPPGMRSIHPHKWRGYLRARSARDSRSNIARVSAVALPSTSSSFFRLFPVCPACL